MHRWFMYVEMHMNDYILVTLMYYCAPNEQMYGIKKHIVHGVVVYLNFLFKIGQDHPKADIYYYPPLTKYCKEVNHYKES